MANAAVDFCGVRLESDGSVPELDHSTIDLPVTIKLAQGDRPSTTTQSWIHEWANGSGVILSIGRQGRQHVLKFGDGRMFSFDRDSRTVRYTDSLDSTARHQLLDQVLPRVLDDLGHLMIHGSAIDTQNGAVIFIGDAGLGKSTLAGSFQNAGVDLLSDDCMRLTTDPDGGVSCVPTYRSLRLWPDSAEAVMPTATFEPMAAYSDKRRLDLPEAAAADLAKVVAICVLAAPSPDAGEPIFAPLAPAQAVALLLGQCFRLDPTDAAATKRTFERCADVVERVPVVELSYPRDYDRLPEVREAVLQRAASGDWLAASAT